jgi:hypothetical protein
MTGASHNPRISAEREHICDTSADARRTEFSGLEDHAIRQDSPTLRSCLRTCTRPAAFSGIHICRIPPILVSVVDANTVKMVFLVINFGKVVVCMHEVC